MSPEDAEAGFVLGEAGFSQGLNSGGEAAEPDGRPGGGAGPVGRAVGVVEAEPLGMGAVDDQVTLVNGAVVGLAQQQHLVGVVAAPVGPADAVVLVEERVVAAAGDGAATAVSSDDLSANGGRDGLGRAGSPPGRSPERRTRRARNGGRLGQAFGRSARAFATRIRSAATRGEWPRIR